MLNWLKNAYSRPVLSTDDLDQESIGEDDLVCDVQLGFARGSVHARVEVSVYSGCLLYTSPSPRDS